MKPLNFPEDKVYLIQQSIDTLKLKLSVINARTGQLTFYHVDGDDIKNNADENYKTQKWHASMPIIYNISDRSV